MFGLRATYFVDPVFSFALGISPLRDVVGMIQDNNQELGLHLHPEWLNDPRCAGLPAFAGPLLHTYGNEDQFALVRAGMGRLAEAGGHRVVAFRAGSWGASRMTIAATARNGLRFDSSLNAIFKTSFPDLDEGSRLVQTQPFKIEDVWEFPVTTFADGSPAGVRPLHVCATSFDEMRLALEHARDRNWYAVVIVLHSFEFVRKKPSGQSYRAEPCKLLTKRFEQLCSYLAGHSDQYETCHFRDIDVASIPIVPHRAMAKSSMLRTTIRMVQQLVSRVY
jgi:hypothetical protein